MKDRLSDIKFIDAVFYAVSFFGLYSSALFMWSEVHDQETDMPVQSRTDGRGGRAGEAEVSTHYWHP